MPKDQIVIIKNIEIPPKYYALFNASNIDMFRNEFKSLNADEQKEAIGLYENMLKVKKKVLAEMKGMVNASN